MESRLKMWNGIITASSRIPIVVNTYASIEIEKCLYDLGFGQEMAIK